MTQYIPLRLHTEFSLIDGTVRIADAIDFAQNQHFPALAITDAMNLFATIKFYTKCRNAGIIPIIGVDIELEPLDGAENASHLLLLAKNHAGYLKLCEWLTEAYLYHQDSKHAQIPWSLLENGDTQDLICLSGAVRGAIGQAILANHFDQATQIAQKLAKLFPNAFYLEIQRLPEIIPEDASADHIERYRTLAHESQQALSGSLKIATELDLPVVATHPIQFMNVEDFVSHEIRVCINAGDVLSDTRRVRQFHPSQYFPTHDEMCERFADIPEALANSVNIAKRCHIEITLGKNYLPQFPTPNNLSLNDFLRMQAKEGLTERLEQLYPNPAEREQRLPEYTKRLDFELETIIKMGFPGYFLIVADFINWAKNNGCPVGPGRGSGAGSLVAYALKITNLDPLRYNLIFERFLNPERVSMPDFDVDFCQENRWRVIEYVRQKYGTQAVSQIITFGTLSSKAVIRDVGRVLQYPFPVCDKLSKLIPLEKNKPVNIAKAITIEPDLMAYAMKEEAEELLSQAQKLENLTRGVGMHAGGVLIAPHKLTDFCPVYRASDEDASPVSMFDKDDVEAVGLVKFDFLGLRNLTIIEMAKEFIAKYRKKQIDINNIPLDDAKVYRNIFVKGNTIAVFQFESVGMRQMLQEAKPRLFEEIIALVSLYRPGPMQVIPSFIQRMHGKEEVEYIHPMLEEILKPTYGITVYQEQVMQTAQICAGYSLGRADILRKAMGKKKQDEMEKQQVDFVKGALKNNISEKKAHEIFSYMEKFAEYGFNKSHAAAYALVSYQTAWLKYYYPAEFISASMSTEMNNTDQLKVFYHDAKINGIEFLLPSVNHSFYHFIPVSPKEIRYALGAIKGTGEGAVEAIIQARENGGVFKDLFDFCQRVDKQSINRRTLEALICAGAFDDINPDRATLFANIELAMEYAEQQKDNELQYGLFDAFDTPITEEVKLKTAEKWSSMQQLTHEKEALGFYVSDHPFMAYIDEIHQLCTVNLTVAQAKEGIRLIGGFVSKIRTMNIKSGSKLTFMTIEDDTGSLEIMLTEEALSQFTGELVIDQVLFFQSVTKKIKIKEKEEKQDPDKPAKPKLSDKPQKPREVLRTSASAIYTPKDIRMKYAKGLEINIWSDMDTAQKVLHILEYASTMNMPECHKVPLHIIYHCINGITARLSATNENAHIYPTQEIIDQFIELLGRENCKIKY